MRPAQCRWRRRSSWRSRAVSCVELAALGKAQAGQVASFVGSWKRIRSGAAGSTASVAVTEKRPHRPFAGAILLTGAGASL